MGLGCQLNNINQLSQLYQEETKCCMLPMMQPRTVNSSGRIHVNLAVQIFIKGWIISFQ